MKFSIIKLGGAWLVRVGERWTFKNDKSDALKWAFARLAEVI